ncbi:reverse transcriptase domain-containing protein [Tanacetum coccineum]
MTSGREITPPLGFSAIPITTTIFAATTLENTPMAYRASTSANPNPVISPTFVEANYEAIKSLLRDRHGGERTVGFEGAQSRGESRVERNTEGGRPSEEAPRGNRGQSVNLPPLLTAHLGRDVNGQPLQSSLTSAYGGQALPNNIEGISLLTHLSFPTQTPPGNLPMGGKPTHLPQKGHAPQTFANSNTPSQNGFTYPTNMPTNNYPFYTQPMYTFLNVPVYTNPNLTSAVLNPVGSVTHFVRWIEDYPLPDGLKMPSHIASYDGKGDPDNFLHLFEGAIRMQKWLMPVACHMFTYTLKDSARIWWNSEKAGFVHGLRTRSLVEHLSTDLPSTYKGLIEKTYTWVEAREVATNGALSDRRDSFERSKKSSWDNNRGQKNKDEFSPYRGPNHGLLPSLSKSPKEILATEKAARSFEPLPKMFESKRLRDMSKYCHFHKDYGHDTNDFRHLRTQIQEAVNSGKLSHLVKGIKKERTKSSDTPRGESRKDKGTAPAEAPTLMVNNAPVIIEAKIFGRKVRRVYMDSKSSCEIIYEHCFEKLNPTIKATKVDLKTPLVVFSGERSWSIGEVLLEITIGDAPISKTETLNFVIVRSDSSHNMLLGRTAMQRMGIVVSTIHRAINFHTKKGIGIVLSAGETDEGTKRARKILSTNKERVLSGVNAEE